MFSNTDITLYLTSFGYDKSKFDALDQDSNTLWDKRN